MPMMLGLEVMPMIAMMLVMIMAEIMGTLVMMLEMRVLERTVLGVTVLLPINGAGSYGDDDGNINKPQ